MSVATVKSTKVWYTQNGDYFMSVCLDDILWMVRDDYRSYVQWQIQLKQGKCFTLDDKLGTELRAAWHAWVILP